MKQSVQFLKAKKSHYVFILILLALSLPVRAIPAELLVFYPEVRKPYTKIYQDIITGIRNANPNNTVAIPIRAEENYETFISAVKTNKPDSIVALGSGALEIALQIAPDVPIVAGAISRSSSTTRGISMIVDPAVVINKLLLLDNNINHIHVVTDSSNKQDQLRAAIDYAQSVNISFTVHEAKTIKAAASEYRNLLKNLGTHDAIWLMRDKALNDTSLLSLILETAWDRKIKVFSSNPTHVKRGALFSIYPNNTALGASLARLANDTDSQTNAKFELKLLKDIYIAGNERTLRHLGLTQANDTHQVLDNIL
ncbi:MAG TPA: hypothetical protein DCF62_11775 [Porticoccaceae bacterium]|nr:hypothetical protein [Porticoccaceae bacterium]